MSRSAGAYSNRPIASREVPLDTDARPVHTNADAAPGGDGYARVGGDGYACASSDTDANPSATITHFHATRGSDTFAYAYAGCDSHACA